jgi:protein-L-isoaspartate(D-aspartate) O-methyltransferase
VNIRGFEGDRSAMVRHQLLEQGIRDRRVLEAMERIPRHLFLEPQQWDLAYKPQAVPIGSGQTISQPYMVATMTEALQLRGDERVLEIGTGSGYQAAVLGGLAAQIVSLERIASLAFRAQELLRELGLDNVQLVVGDGTSAGFLRTRFDRIIVTAAAPALPESLRTLLADPGILVCPVGERGLQVLQILHRAGGRERIESGCACRFVPLLGAEGFAGD